MIEYDYFLIIGSGMLAAAFFRLTYSAIVEWPSKHRNIRHFTHIVQASGCFAAIILFLTSGADTDGVYMDWRDPYFTMCGLVIVLFFAAASSGAAAHVAACLFFGISEDDIQHTRH